MKKPKFKMDCGDFDCKYCALNGELCDQFDAVIDQLNKIAGTIANALEEPKPSLKRGDKVQVSSDGDIWHNRYFVEETADGKFLAALYKNDSFTGAREYSLRVWEYCRLYKEE